jgi:hypothetical protein
MVDGGFTGCLDDDAAGVAKIDRHAVDHIARGMVGAHQRNGKAAEIGGAAGIHRIELLEALRDKPHPEIVIRRDRGAVRFCDVERVADVIEMAVREHDVFNALDRRGFVGNEGGIAGEERIDQEGVPGKIEAKSGVAKPGDVHDRP